MENNNDQKGGSNFMQGWGLIITMVAGVTGVLVLMKLLVG
jgi:hypothetical protein